MATVPTACNETTNDFTEQEKIELADWGGQWGGGPCPPEHKNSRVIPLALTTGISGLILQSLV